MKTLKKFKWNIIVLMISAILIAISFHLPETHALMDYLEFVGGMGIGIAIAYIFRSIYNDKKKG